jgi:integrase
MAIGSVFQVDDPSQCAVSVEEPGVPVPGEPGTGCNHADYGPQLDTVDEGPGTVQSYRHVCFVHVSAILSAAVDDKKIAVNPCQSRSVTRPTPGQHKIVPWTDTRLKAVWLALSPIVQVTIPLGAGAGLRQGEMFGISPHDIDREANIIHVVRQIQQVNTALMFCLPKREKAQDVFLSDHTLAELHHYMAMFPQSRSPCPGKKPTEHPPPWISS